MLKGKVYSTKCFYQKRAWLQKNPGKVLTCIKQKRKVFNQQPEFLSQKTKIKTKKQNPRQRELTKPKAN